MTLSQSADRLQTIVAGFAGRRVLVLGDAILDEYLSGDCSRISPEAPVPVIRVHTIRRVLGGAANTAANIAALGGRPTLVASIGHDDPGAALMDAARAGGVDLRPMSNGTPTLRKTRVVGQQQQIVRLDYEEVGHVDRAADAAILDAFDSLAPEFDIVVMSDYAKGFFSEPVAWQIIARAHEAGCQVIVDPRPQHRDFYHGCDYVTPNWRESQSLLGLVDLEPTADAVRTVARDLAAALAANVVLTLGPHGISFCSRTGDEQFAMPTLAREVFDVSGAGDTVVATLALALAAGADHASAVALANKAASVVVGKFGTATLTPEELLGEDDALRVVPRAALRSLAATLRAKGKRLVTVSGTFDLLHTGHLQVLADARRQGDVLVVGLSSDASLRARGGSAPIVSERHRAEILLALRAVDYVHIFDEPDPASFLSELRPDVHVNAVENAGSGVQRGAVVHGGVVDVGRRLPSTTVS
jgi:D-beta-D-heptose 7-phosphate kinase/D-beta-D-heptose 1-phosphate adenosyltransferase